MKYTRASRHPTAIVPFVNFLLEGSFDRSAGNEEQDTRSIENNAFCTISFLAFETTVWRMKRRIIPRIHDRTECCSKQRWNIVSNGGSRNIWSQKNWAKFHWYSLMDLLFFFGDNSFHFKDSYIFALKPPRISKDDERNAFSILSKFIPINVTRIICTTFAVRNWMEFTRVKARLLVHSEIQSDFIEIEECVEGTTSTKIYLVFSFFFFHDYATR